VAKLRTSKKHRGWRYKNITLTLLGVFLAYQLSHVPWFHTLLTHLGGLGYIGSFFAGMLFVSTFTVATGVIILFTLVQYLHPIEIALIAGLGAVLGDLLIFRFVKDNLKAEIEDIFDHNLNGKHVRKLFKTKYFSWTLPVLGAIIIASPLPDEIGVSMLGISKMSTFKFVLLSFVLNSIGIFLVVFFSAVIT
jgi:uncharacterized membrane protein YdjX (TVP38/TMEM64 family)